METAIAFEEGAGKSISPKKTNTPSHSRGASGFTSNVPSACGMKPTRLDTTTRHSLTRSHMQEFAGRRNIAM